MMTAGLHTDIEIGRFKVMRSPLVWVESHRHVPVSRAGVVLPDPSRAMFRTIRKGDPVRVAMGYRDRAASDWMGSVAYVKPGRTKDQIEVVAAGLELPLVRTKIIQSWEHETPEAIIAWAIRQAGFSVGRLDSPGVVIPSFSADSLTAWEVARSVEHTLARGFGKDMSRWALWVDAAGKAHWGDFDADADDTPVVATGAGLIRHTPGDGVGEHHRVETFLWPGLRHTMPFKMTDTQRGVSGVFRALGVRHEVSSHRARTFLTWGTEHARF